MINRSTLLFLSLALTGLSGAASAATTASVATPPVADASCILAGRLDAERRWAPSTPGVELLNAAGQQVSSASPQALATVTAVRLKQAALLSTCHGSQALPEGTGVAGPKKPVPAVNAGAQVIPVTSMAYPPLRLGGVWVEVQLKVPADRVIQITRQ